WPRPRLDDPLKATRPNRRATPPRIRCHSNRWRLACRESESIFLVNVSTEINTAAFLHEAGIPESFQRVESFAGYRRRNVHNLRSQPARVARYRARRATALARRRCAATLPWRGRGGRFPA